jgi:hypothetical protein
MQRRHPAPRHPDHRDALDAQRIEGGDVEVHLGVEAPDVRGSEISGA